MHVAWFFCAKRDLYYDTKYFWVCIFQQKNAPKITDTSSFQKIFLRSPSKTPFQIWLDEFLVFPIHLSWFFLAILRIKERDAFLSSETPDSFILELLSFLPNVFITFLFWIFCPKIVNKVEQELQPAAHLYSNWKHTSAEA